MSSIIWRNWSVYGGGGGGSGGGGDGGGGGGGGGLTLFCLYSPVLVTFIELTSNLVIGFKIFKAYLISLVQLQMQFNHSYEEANC